MKAIRIQDNKPSYIQADLNEDSGVKVKVVASSICGSDLHMMDRGWAEGRILGHEFAGIAPDGTPVAVEPLIACGHCDYCEEGLQNHCEHGTDILGVSVEGGMAEYVMVPEKILLPLPSGLDLQIASLVEPLAVALHGLNRARLQASDKVLIIGAGPVGLMTAAALQSLGIAVDISARHEHQKIAAEKLGAGLNPGDGYHLVMDAVGSTDSIKEALSRLRPMGRIGMVGSFWDPAQLDVTFCMKEAEVIAATTYQHCTTGTWEFRDAANILSKNAAIADALITHRFPLEAAEEAFATAADRAKGAIKVVFDIPA